ncbi:MAG: hypothetical protein A3E87_08205 [Gammaproteobacteria bacterium RIFCSPHIGHO2_12_FULL_35_23]|nr:MAG: hypothetical protein A3E87_08205 [Gammaproteobacteria bacterium RIFCSPHIGHO2_12_FULL_35_23]
MPTILDLKTLIHDYDFAKGNIRKAFSTRASLVNSFVNQFATREDHEITSKDKLFICQQILGLDSEYFEPITPQTTLRIEFFQNVLKLLIPPLSISSLNKNKIFFIFFNQLNEEYKLHLITYNSLELINLGQKNEDLCQLLQEIINTTTNPALLAQAFVQYQEKGGDIKNIEEKINSCYAAQLCEAVNTGVLNKKQQIDCLDCLLFLLEKESETYRPIVLRISAILFNILPKHIPSRINQFLLSSEDSKLITLTSKIFSRLFQEKKLLVPDKCFIIPTTTTLNTETCLEGIAVEENWLTQLKNLLPSENERSKLEEKIGTASTYSHKSALIQLLKILYARLSGKLDTTLGTITQDEKAALVDRFNEGVVTCAPGFHTRIRHMVSNFTKPKSVTELLYKIRLELIEKIARSITDGVHHYNGLFQAARTAGLGVIPPNDDDVHSAAIGEAELNKLKEKFDLLYNEHNLPFLLIQQIKSELYSAGYRNINTEGYTLGNYSYFYDYLKLILEKDVSMLDIFILSENKITDINWEFVQKILSRKLFSEQFLITKKFDFLPTSKQKLYENIHAYIESLCFNHETEQLADFFNNPDSFWNCLSTREQYKIFTKRSENYTNLLAKAIEWNFPKLSLFLEVVNKFPDYEKIRFFLRVFSSWSDSLLIIAAKKIMGIFLPCLNMCFI